MNQAEHINTIKKKLKKLSISTTEGYTLLDYDTILYLKADNNYTTLYLTNGSKIVATKNLGYFERKLEQELFIRIHHSFVVNLNKVSRYTKSRGAHIVLENNISLPVSRSYKDTVLAFFI